MLGRTGLRSADKTLPPGALITFLQKGLQYVGIEETLQQDQEQDNAALKPSSLSSSRVKTGNENDADFSLLSPATVSAIARTNPPIQLSVPPATAAAAIKARLEAEAKLQAQQNAAVVSNQLSSNGPLVHHPGAGGVSQVSVLDVDANAALARQAIAAQAAAAQAAAAMSQLQQQMGHQPSAIADAFTQHQRVAAAADIMALQQQGAALAMAQAADSASEGGKRPASGAKRVPRKQKKSRTEGETPQRSLDQAYDDSQSMDIDNNDEHERPSHAASGMVNGEIDRNGQAGKSSDNGGTAHPIEPATSDVPPEPDDTDTAAGPDEILELQMHESEVFMCAWNPVFTNLIATGSGDASARIWEMNGTHSKDGVRAVKLLPHGNDIKNKKNKDVTTLEWSSDGEFLATGSYDGVARVWARNGSLLHTLKKHRGPIFSLKWNRKGNFLLSGSYDLTAIVWDVSEVKPDPVVQRFTDHEAPVLDVDWRDDTTFASCSTDKTVNIYRVGEIKPVKVYRGHVDEVNAVKWDPSGAFLASCSDDCTAKVWEVDSDRTEPLYDFTSHSQEIYTVKWSPTGPGSANATSRRILATASFDGTVRLWDVADGSCYRVFSRHRDSVYSVAFAPSGEYLASGSLAGQMYIWNIEEGRHVKSYKGRGDIFEVAWNKEETMVAACFSSNVVAVIDFERPSAA